MTSIPHPTAKPEHLLAYPIVFQTPVAWGEMDAFQHVNNVVYFKYFESARILYFERIGLTQFMKEHGIGPILASTSCRFRRPLGYPDQVKIGASVDTIESDRFTMKYAVYSQSLGDIAAVGQGKIVCYDYRKHEKATLPEPIRLAIEELQATAQAPKS